jgi:hypothetical protein
MSATSKTLVAQPAPRLARSPLGPPRSTSRMPGILLFRSDLPGLATRRCYNGQCSCTAARLQRNGVRQSTEAACAACCGAYQLAAAAVQLCGGGVCNTAVRLAQ